jgi:hypothetical protein
MLNNAVSLILIALFIFEVTLWFGSFVLLFKWWLLLSQHPFDLKMAEH